MTGDDLSKEMTRVFFIVATVIFLSGVLTVIGAQTVWPFIKTWIHWATG
jgi:hypothetical protein